MPKISIRQDERGGQAVYSGGTLLMDGLGEGEARNLASFFRATERMQGGRTGQASPSGGRGQTVRRGAR